MAHNKSNCDTCGKRTFVHLFPQNGDAEPLMEKKTRIIPQPIIDPKTNQPTRDKNGNLLMKEEEEIYEVPVMTTERRQNPITGKIEKFPVPKMKENIPRSIVIRLKVGGEFASRDFCRECLAKHPKAKQMLEAAQYLWDLMEEMEPVE